MQYGQQPAPGGNAPAVSSKRMAYGTYAAQGRESRDREELFAGAQQHGAAAQQRARAWDGHEQQQSPTHEEQLTNAQLMQQGLEQHRDTTVTTKRALQIVEQTKEIQGGTQAALADQREQMRRIEDDLDKMGQDLTYSERLLRFMKLCCCVGFFCSCCTEPARNAHDKQWHGAGGAPSQAPMSQSMAQRQGGGGKQQQQQQQQQAAGAHSNGSRAYPGVSTYGLQEAGCGEQAAAIDQETQQQNQYLDEISKGLDQLKFGAQRINEELRYQDAHADRIRRDADTLEVKLHSVNREGFRRI